MIEWAVAHPHHMQTFFDGLYPDTRVVYGANGATFVRDFDLAEGGVHVSVTLSVDFNGVQITVGDTPIFIRVFPSLKDPLHNGQYVVKGSGCVVEYKDTDFMEILKAIADVHYNRNTASELPNNE